MSEDGFLARPHDAGGSPSLQAHLETTREKITEITAESGELTEVAQITAYLHDFGKLTSWFQEYIQKVDTADKTDSIALTQEQRRYKQHARLSAYATEYALQKRDIGVHWRTCAFIAVARHHQSLPDTRQALNRATNLERKQNQRRFQLIQKQLKDIYDTAPKAADSFLSKATDGEGGLEDFIDYLHQSRTHATLTDYQPDEATYGDLVHLWGTLITADKLASAGLEWVTAPTPPSGAIVDHIDGLSVASDSLKQQLNTHRETARESVIENLNAFQTAETDLATITLPTGFGKTLTGLQAALPLAEPDGRVIYALPYTSIIDQVDDVLRDVFSVSPSNPEYTVHHHLADTRTLPSDSRVDTDDSELLAKTWQAPLVLTTFVQVFESLAGPTNRQSMKLPALEDAIVLLDEPQALPKKWWRFVAWAADLLVEEFGATVVLMTATQPELLRRIDHANEPLELVDDVESHFQFLAENPRVRYTLDASVEAYLDQPRSATPLSLDSAVSQLLEDDATSVLSVGNTIANVTEQGEQLENRLEDSRSLNRLLSEVYQDIPSAEAFTDRLTSQLIERARSHEGPTVATLTTRLRPIDRTVLLQAIRQLLADDKPLYVASTQLIEAGVDLSFESLYRDLAPFPSLVQAAGRCNREFGDRTAEVTVWRLEHQESGRPPSDIIYSDPYDLLAPTRAALQKFHTGESISEYTMAREGAAEYFCRLHEETKPGDRELVQAAEQAKCGTLGKESLIRDRGDQVDVFIAVTENETRLFRAYRQFAASGNYRRVQALRDVIQKRVVSLSNRDEALTHEEVVPFPDMEDMYYVDATDRNSRGALGIANPF